MTTPPTSTLSVQVNQIDYTLNPSGPYDGTDVPFVPVIRVYGPTSTGHKACVHVHQVYPYFFVEYFGSTDPVSVKKYIIKFMLSLNHAIALSLKRDLQSMKSQFVRAVVLVKGVHFYGFHASYSPFLKILIADPSVYRRAVAIVQSGSIMGTRFRAYECHIGYILQFLADFGLYGCGMLEMSQVYRRIRAKDEDDSMDAETPFDISIHLPESRMELEFDVVAHQILNRHRLLARNVHHKLEIPGPQMQSQRFVLGVEELWEDERKRRVARGLPPEPQLPQEPTDSSRGAGGNWVSELRWWERLRERIALDAEEPAISSASDNGWEKKVMTTFESAEALWEPSYRTWKPDNGRGNLQASNEYQHSPDLSMSHGSDNFDIDVHVLSGQEMSSLLDLEEQEGGVLENTENTAIFDEENVPDDAANEDSYLEDVDPPGDEQEAGGTEYRATETTENGIDVNSDRNMSIERREANDLVLPRTQTPNGRSSRKDTAPMPSLTVNQLDSPKPSPIRESSVRQGLDDPVVRPHTPNLSAVIQNTPKQENEAHDELPRQYTGTFMNRDGDIEESPIAQPEKAVESPYRVATNCYIYDRKPPSRLELNNIAHVWQLPSKIYQDPYYSSEADTSDQPWEFAGLVYHLKGGKGTSILDDWDHGYGRSSVLPKLDDRMGANGWEYAKAPPSVRDVQRWLRTDIGKRHLRIKKAKMRSQIKGPTPKNIYGLKSSLLAKEDVSTRQRQHISLLSLEVFAATPHGKLPDPSSDEIVAAFYSFQKSDAEPYLSGILAVDAEGLKPKRLRTAVIESVSSELDLINGLVDVVVDLDPDILAGWDVQSTSWGYLIYRGQSWGLEISDLLSRVGQTPDKSSSVWESRHTCSVKVGGRHVLNVWRLMRSEMNLPIYTFENVAFHSLRRRMPKYSNTTLTKWYQSPAASETLHLLCYLKERTESVLDMLEKADIVTKTAEFARVFGVDFYSVLSRGSQFKVESFMFRIAKPESFVLLSPSKTDVGKQNAAECMPLIMEPQSSFYNSPLLVLDFQSLYPSVMIAYNYCYSTCLGRVSQFQGHWKFGVVDLNLPPGLLATLKDHITIAPNGLIYVKHEVRRGLLGRMLNELLDSRVMVKQGMKDAKDDKALKKILNARQMGLKYIANVTYGYTSASFSGRMPAVEIADSIVQTGRETLEKAIELIHNDNRWGAEVVYGDTDSLFIYLKGKTREQAFMIGHEIANAVTASNPSPIKLKLEKVYLPCVLLAKKRYVGFKYEDVDEKNPSFEAKGIETVRRDGIPAQRKMTETCLKILFRTQDISRVKRYCCNSWRKIIEQRASIQDFIFAKEVRLGTYSDSIPPPPGAAVAARRMTLDHNDEPNYGERVPYVITRGQAFSKLVDRAVDPMEMLQKPHLRIDSDYYIARVLIPPLARIFNLIGADVRQWYDDLPKASNLDASSPAKAGQTDAAFSDMIIEGHFTASACIICKAETYNVICSECRYNKSSTIATLQEHMNRLERRIIQTHKVCSACTVSAPAEAIECISLDCWWLYARKRAEHRAEAVVELTQLIQEVENEDLDELQDEIQQIYEEAAGWDDSDQSSDEALPGFYDDEGEGSASAVSESDIEIRDEEDFLSNYGEDSPTE